MNLYNQLLNLGVDQDFAEMVCFDWITTNRGSRMWRDGDTLSPRPPDSKLPSARPPKITKTAKRLPPAKPPKITKAKTVSKKVSERNEALKQKQAKQMDEKQRLLELRRVLRGG